ncbi:MAG: hypothetical protein ACRCUE_07835 [Bosea sp. (in: a-proteobacteria)]
MARQELELDQELAGSGAHITNTGSQPLVILPENAAFPTGSDIVDPGFRPPAERDIASSDRAPQLNINASDIPHFSPASCLIDVISPYLPVDERSSNVRIRAIGQPKCSLVRGLSERRRERDCRRTLST